MNAQDILLVVAAAFVVFTALDWLRSGGGFTTKRRTWLTIAAIFVAVSVLTRVA